MCRNFCGSPGYQNIVHSVKRNRHFFEKGSSHLVIEKKVSKSHTLKTFSVLTGIFFVVFATQLRSGVWESIFTDSAMAFLVEQTNTEDHFHNN